jgi:hypothetical protein
VSRVCASRVYVSRVYVIRFASLEFVCLEFLCLELLRLECRSLEFGGLEFVCLEFLFLPPTGSHLVYCICSATQLKMVRFVIMMSRTCGCLLKCAVVKSASGFIPSFTFGWLFLATRRGCMGTAVPSSLHPHMHGAVSTAV